MKKDNILLALCKAVLAGILISIGGTVFLKCDNKVVGAVFFSVALLCICNRGFYLFTGKIGYLLEGQKDLLLMLIVNLLTALVGGLFLPKELATSMVAAKLELSLWQVLVKAIGCGALMYLAVAIYKQGKDIGILFCVPTFILCGFEHSIADTFYFSVARAFTGRAALFLAIAVIGNTLGAVLINWLEKGMKKE